MKTTLKLFIAIALLSLAAFGQTTLSTTTLGAAVTAANQTTITLASTSTMQTSGPSNQINTVLWVDKEFMWVTSVTDSTHVVVTRAKGLGAGAYPTTHANSAKVYFANTATYGNTIVPAPRFFRNEQASVEPAPNSGCTATNEIALPKVYLSSGNRYNCLSSIWILEGNGSSAQNGIGSFTAYCTGTVGSATTNWLNDTSCSGATSSLPRNVASRAGVLANLSATSTANFVGTGGSVITLVKNGTATAVACTPAAGAKTCVDTTHSVAVAVGDTLAFSMLTATSDTAAEVVANVVMY